MAWNGLFVFVSSMCVVSSMEAYYQPPRGSSVWGYFTPPLLQREPSQSPKSAMEAMVDLTNSLGVAILQDNTFSRGNFAFSPYGVASVLVVLYEGARGESARQIHRAVGFPSDKDIIRVGFRDIHRHLRSYFSHEGYLSGISLNKETSSLKPEYKRILRYYGYDIDLGQTLDDEDDDMTVRKPSTASPTAQNGTTVSTTSSGASSPGSTTSAPNKDLKKPDSADLVTGNTTTVENTIKEIKTTTVSTGESTTKEIQAAVSSTEPSEVVTEPGQNTIEPEVTTGGVKPAESATEPEKAADESPVENTKPDETATKPTDKLPSDNAATTQEMETIEPTVPNKQTTVTEQPDKEEMAENTTTRKPHAVTTEIIKATTTLNLTSESQTNEVATSTEPVKTQTEQQTPVEDVSKGIETESSTENKEDSPTTVESATENVKQDTKVPDVSSEPQEQLNTIPNSKDEVTEAVTEARTTVNGADVTTTESVNTEESADLEFSGRMLMPQSEHPVGTETTEKYSPTSASALIVEATSENFEETTNSHPQGTDSLPERLSTGKNVIKMSGKIPDHEEKKRIRKIVDVRVPLWLAESGKSRKIRTITDYLKSPRSPDLSLQLQNGMYDTHVSRNADLYRSLPRMLFLVDGSVDTPVPMMTYTNVFPYTYIPKLHSKALEFPLDDIRYKLLILLPVERRGLRQLIYDLLDYPLSNVLSAMKPARVKAVVPTFMVEGFVILTSSLQKLGIWDVFDPRKANLSGMSMDPELYVRNVEQSVTVVIRNYVEILDIQTRTMAARYMEYEFEATHPFLYFVLDTSTNVALMAGQILDPLNSRIY